MPLVVLSAAEAAANRKSNPFAGWGDRGGANRVEPVASPEFDVPFKMKPGERVFTVGSCFARNVEAELVKRGFQLPMRELFKTPAFDGLDVGIINNYGAPSIYNELAWAFGEAEYRPEDHLLEVMGGKFADIHLEPTRKPEPWDVVLGRRLAIRQAYQLAATCSVVIMTLGLAELWFDTQTGYYLNVAPRPTVVKNHPDRFELHVLGYDEAYGYLERAMLALAKHAPGVRVVLTVSPVPLMVTQRPMDVMVANTYSKSLLRTAAEAIVAKFDFVTYFPSYESFVLSDRKLAWKSDMIHPQADLVALNVGRMVSAFVEGESEALIENEMMAVEQARVARKLDPLARLRFFEGNAAWSDRSREFALEHAAAVVSIDPQRALDLLGEDDTLIAAATRGNALIALGRAEEAYDLLNPLCSSKMKLPAVWMALLNAAMARQDPELVEMAMGRMGATMPFRSSPAHLATARWFRTRGDLAKSLLYAERATAHDANPAAVVEYSELLLELGRLEDARNALDKLPSDDDSLPRLTRLRQALRDIPVLEAR